MAASRNFPPNFKVIALLDIDAFECQIWQRMYPKNEMWGTPCVVCDQTGRITSVTYEAKALGISRDIRIGPARKLARDAGVKLMVFDKPNDREKPDSKETRYASWEILDSLKEYCNKYAFGVILEYASSDEFYLDITEEVKLQIENEAALKPVLVVETKTFLEGGSGVYEGQNLKARIRNQYEHSACHSLDLLEEKALVYGALLMQEISTFVFNKTKFSASVGVGPNKLIAKLAVSLHRPNGITALPEGGLLRLGRDIPLEKIPGLGGKTGVRLKDTFKIATINELRNLTVEQLEDTFGADKALDLHFKSRGISDELVKAKYYYDEVNCGKNFTGQIISDETLYYHLHCLVEEIIERLAEERTRHSRIPSFIRVKLEYSKTRSSSELTPWFCHIDRNQFTEANVICDYVVGKIFRGIGNISEVHSVNRICLSAKQFQKLAHSPAA